VSKKKPKTIDASCPVTLMGCEGEVIVEMTPTEAVSMIEKAWQENRRLRQENATITAERDEARKEAESWQDDALRMMRDRNTAERERDEARRLLKAVVDMMRDNMAPDATHPKHVCDFIYCPEIATCMVCENWTDALVMCYPDDFQDKEEGK
jgi:flagellar biosynthesis GTPase FlhF